MSSSFYLFLSISISLIVLVIVFIILWRQHGHSELYNEGVQNENDGQYFLALKNYDDALNEIRKLNVKNKLSRKITERIKVLHSTIEYEKNFQAGKGA